MSSKKSKNRGNKSMFGGIVQGETATFSLIQMILVSVITALVIYMAFFKT